MLDAQPDIGAYLAISTLVLRYPAYAEYYRERSRQGATVILDNPVHEGEQFTINETLAAADIVSPSIIVIPDTIDSVDETMFQAIRHAPTIAHYFPQAQLMGVPHAFRMRDYMACAIAMSKIPHVTYLGVSLELRLQNDVQALMRRRERVRELATNPETERMRIHLLGISEQCTELSDPLFQRACISADTSQWAVWALSGTPVLPPPPITRPYPGRKRFGGSWQYFGMYDYPFGDQNTLRSNLLTWTNYAYEMQDKVLLLPRKEET